MLTIKELHIGFQKKRQEKLLFSADYFSFLKGDFVALIGPNGAGKTTFFNVILGSETELSGAISYRNQALLTLNKRERIAIFGYVPSQFGGVNHLTVYELVAMGRAPYTNILNQLSSKDHQLITETLQVLGIWELRDKNTLFLSDGERQIAMIAKALVQDTPCLILDEPTAFLDYNNRKRVLEILQQIAIKKEKIIFISSHDLNLCFQYCNRIIGINTENRKLESFYAPFQSETIIQQIFGGKGTEIKK